MESWERVAKMIGIEPTLSTAPKDTPAPKMPAGAKQYCRYCFGKAGKKIKIKTKQNLKKIKCRSY